MTNAPISQNTTAFYVQSAVAFGCALVATIYGIWNMPAEGWIRGFMTVSILFLTTSCFTLAKCVRDAQESSQVSSRLDQARVDRILAEHDPFAQLQ
jgi:hypothetical protein